MSLEGFLWVRIMEDEVSEHSKKLLGSFCWEGACQHILYNILWVKEDERRARVVKAAGKKSWMQQGFNP
jgi:hypothetical protein